MQGEKEKGKRGSFEQFSALLGGFVRGCASFGRGREGLDKLLAVELICGDRARVITSGSSPT